ncbi:MAG TPA: transposase [Ktedonobacterales bacterium]|jgi:hypothetical protein
MFANISFNYLALCQQYTTHFVMEATPGKYIAPCFDSPLSQRWQRVAIQQAAGIAQSWRSNRENALEEFQEAYAAWEEKHKPDEPPPVWKEWNTPVLKEICLQVNANVALLEKSEDSTFEYWLRLSTLERGKPLLLPVKLAPYHQTALEGKQVNTSVTLTRKTNGWWLTLSYTEEVKIETPQAAPVVGVDVGIANFITTSTGKSYGTFHGKLAARHKRDRAKRRRKAKLRACLEKKGVKKLPSTRNQKLARHVRQEINRAVNQFYADHAGYQVAYEQLSVRTMKFKSRRMNAYLYASNLAHIPKQLAWGALKRKQRAQKVKSAYSSQECRVCHHVSRVNRPSQQTFCCWCCRHAAHADVNAAGNTADRLNDQEIRNCQNRQEIKLLLQTRHQEWFRHSNGCS